MNLTHEEYKSLIAPYVLGAVSEDEMAAVREHIATCDECMAEADEYSDVVSSLALAVSDDELPDGFVDEVMTKVAAEPSRSTSRRRASEALRAADRERAGRGPLIPPDAPAEVVPIRRRRSGVLLATAAAFIVIAVLSVALISTRADLDEARRDLASEGQRFERLAQQLGGMRLVGEVEGQAVMLPTEGGGVFLASGLAEPPANRTYQVWLLEDSQMISAGTFDVSDGSGGLTTDRSLEDIDGVAVTVEPLGGSEQPTTDPILQSS